MKISDIAKHFALNHVGDAVGQLIGTAAGVKGPVTGGFWASLSKGIPAAFSGEDERKFELLLQKLEVQAQDPANVLFGRRPRYYIILFIQWHFKRRCAGERAVSWWKRNEFQKFVVLLSPDEKAEKSESLEFLSWMVNTIHDSGVTPGEELQNSFELLVDQLEHVPHVPESMAGFTAAFQRFIAEVRVGAYQGYRDTKASIIHHRRALKRRNDADDVRPKGWIDKLID